MDRRQFLKALGLTATALALPIGLVESYPKFNPTVQYGDFSLITDFSLNESNLIQVIEHLYDQIKQTIPKRYRKDIQWFAVRPGGESHYGLGHISWKYVPAKAITRTATQSTDLSGCRRPNLP